MSSLKKTQIIMNLGLQLSHKQLPELEFEPHPYNHGTYNLFIMPLVMVIPKQINLTRVYPSTHKLSQVAEQSGQKAAFRKPVLEND